MEVHHHPISPKAGEKKGFKEYLFEGLMIFVAVTLGFFAESLQEHLGDRAKENEYITSLVKDLTYDSAQYNIQLYKIHLMQTFFDSLYENVKESQRFHYVIQGKWNSYLNQISVDYIPDLPTINQLESTGNMRLIENREVANKIVEYEAMVKGNLDRLTHNVDNAYLKTYAFEDELCDYKHFKNVDATSVMKEFGDSSTFNLYDMRLMTKDSLKLNQFANSFINVKASSSFYALTIRQTKDSALSLLQSINTSYFNK